MLFQRRTRLVNSAEHTRHIPDRGRVLLDGQLTISATRPEIAFQRWHLIEAARAGRHQLHHGRRREVLATLLRQLRLQLRVPLPASSIRKAPPAAAII